MFHQCTGFSTLNLIHIRFYPYLSFWGNLFWHGFRVEEFLFKHENRVLPIFYLDVKKIIYLHPIPRVVKNKYTVHKFYPGTARILHGRSSSKPNGCYAPDKNIVKNEYGFSGFKFLNCTSRNYFFHRSWETKLSDLTMLFYVFKPSNTKNSTD